MNDRDDKNYHIPPAIRRARLDELTIYEVSEDELGILEKGSPDSIYLSISIALLSSALACLLAAPSVNIETELIRFAFISYIVVGFVVGVILLLLWKRSKSSVSDCIEKIRRRLPPEGEPIESRGVE